MYTKPWNAPVTPTPEPQPTLTPAANIVSASKELSEEIVGINNSGKLSADTMSKSQ